MKNTKKLNNKGFSMVELVIVIAIMAVLIAVLAPQFIKYVEQSRVSTDETNASEILKTVQLLAADGTISGDGTITWTTGVIAAAVDGLETDENTALANQIIDALGGEAPAIQSNAHKDATDDTYTVTIETVDEELTISGDWGAGA